ncbi:MAG: hypothetical protein ACREN8_11055 [Candidatus Dormibacteraceae bacterium]
MGIFNSRDKEWEDEFDARLKDPNVEKDVMRNLGIIRPREVRVKDDAGTMRRRNGDGCCNCGQWSVDQHNADFSDKPVVKHSHHHDEPEPREDGPKLFFGIF